MWVAQLSSVENRVGAFLPDSVVVISRLRRVAASRAMYWCSCSSVSASKCGGSWLWVILR